MFWADRASAINELRKLKQSVYKNIRVFLYTRTLAVTHFYKDYL